MHKTVDERGHRYSHDSCLWQFVQTGGPWCRQTVGSLPGGWTASHHSPTCPLVYRRAAAAPPQGPCTAAYRYDLKRLCYVHTDCGRARDTRFSTVSTYLSHYNIYRANWWTYIIYNLNYLSKLTKKFSLNCKIYKYTILKKLSIGVYIKIFNLESIDKEIKNLKKNIFNKKWKSKGLLKYLFYKNSNSRIKKYLKQTNKF